MVSLKGKVVCVSGAAGGIGSATACLLAEKGALLSLADADSKGLGEIARKIRSKYETEVMTTQLDVSKSEDVDGWITSTVQRLSKLSGAVNLAGTVGREFGLKLAHEVSDNDFDLVFAINVRGVMACQRAQLRHIEDGGSIVNAASVSGKMGIPKALSYAASKHAVIGLTRVAAIENGHRNVRVNAIAPGAIDTKMLDIAREAGGAVSGEGLSTIDRMGKPEEVANVIAFLLSDEATFTTGAVYTVDGGMTP